MNERQKHLILKEKARDMLLREGFSDNEIFFEYKIPLKRKKYYKVDVIGIKENNKIIIECGNITRKGKAEYLKNISNQFIHLKYESEGNIKPITLEIDEDLWIKFKEKIPRTITLNDAIVELIKKEVSKNDVHKN